VGGTITIKNTTSGAPAVTDSFGPLYVAGTGASSVTGLVNLLATSAYAGGSLAISNSTSTQLLDTFGTVLYSVGDLSVSGNAQFKASAVVTTNGDFTISGATNAFQDWIGKTYVAAFSSSSQPSLNHGDVTWSGTASVTSRDYLDSTADPKPLWLGRHWTRSGTYADEYGPIWVPGNSSWSITLGSTGNSTILCPLLSSTEHPQISGDIDFGSLTKPMVFFYMCDNNGIYPQVVDWAGTGTFYGLMVINESTIDFSGQVSGGPPAVEGAVFAGCPYDPTHTSGMSMSDIVLEDYDSIAFNQGVLTNVANTSSLKTTILVTQTVPGSWQQLSAK
jgi:hypothetical protein